MDLTKEPAAATPAEAPTTTEDTPVVAAPPSPSSFEVGSSGYVKNGPLMYLSVILEVDPHKGYLVHYKGWNATWDNWIRECEFLPDNEENAELCRELKKKVTAAEKAKKASASASASSSSSTPSKRSAGKKRSSSTKREAAHEHNNGDEGDVEDVNEDDDEEDDADGEDGTNSSSSSSRKRSHTKRPRVVGEVRPASEVADFSQECWEVRLLLPEELKKRAVRDFARVVTEALPCPLPAPTSPKPAIAVILHEYLATKKKRNPSQMDVAQQMCGAVELYFNLVLVPVLLYPNERTRFAALAKVHAGRKWSEVCGAEYLVRFLLRLPHLVTGSALNWDELAVLTSRVNDLARHVGKRAGEVFADGQEGHDEDDYAAEEEEEVTA